MPKLHDPDSYNLMSDSELVQEDFDVIEAGVDGRIAADEANLRHEIIFALQAKRVHRDRIFKAQVELRQWSGMADSKLKELRKLLTKDAKTS